MEKLLEKYIKQNKLQIEGFDEAFRRTHVLFFKDILKLSANV